MFDTKKEVFVNNNDLISCCSFSYQPKTDDGEDDLKKGTQLLEIYALEIQMYTAQKNNKKLKALYEQSLHIKSAIPHPLIMGVIRGMIVYKSPSFTEHLLGFELRDSTSMCSCSCLLNDLCLFAPDQSVAGRCI